MAEKKTAVTLGTNQPTGYPAYGTEGARRLGARQRGSLEKQDELAERFAKEGSAGRARAAARTGRSGPAYSKRRG